MAETHLGPSLICMMEYILSFSAPTLQNGQSHPQKSSVTADKLFE